MPCLMNVFKERNICIFSSSYPSYSGVARDKIFVSRESGSEAEQIFHTAAVFVLILEHIVIVLKEQALLDMESRQILIFFWGVGVFIIFSFNFFRKSSKYLGIIEKENTLQQIPKIFVI